MARDRRGFGVIERRTNAQTGKTTGYRARYTGPDTFRHSRTFTVKRDAEAWLAIEERLIARDEWRPPRLRAQPTSVTVLEYAVKNLELRRLSPRTAEEYQAYLRRFVEGQPLGRMPMASVTSATIGAWLTHVRASTGASMAARVYSFVSSAFNAAVRDGVIDRTPCTVRGASNAPRATPKTIASPEEVAALMQAVPDRYRALVLVAAWGGLRSGELRNLRRVDVDVEAGTVAVHDQVQNVRGQGLVVRDVKTAAARRVVSLPAAVMRVLEAHLRQFGQPGPDGLVFPSRVGKPITQSVLWRVWDTARKQIGRPDLRLHDLRATAATMAARQGATIAELMARLGHTTPAAAMRYQAAMREADARIASALDSVVVLPQGGGW